MVELVESLKRPSSGLILALVQTGSLEGCASWISNIKEHTNLVRARFASIRFAFCWGQR